MPLLLLLAALIQMRGLPLAGGAVEGSAVVALERADGGDTPVLTLGSSRGPVRLLLDTGASSSMVTPALSARLGLATHPLSRTEFALAGGGQGCQELRPHRTHLPELSLKGAEGSAGLRFTGIEALVLPVGALPAHVDGVLGAPTLRRLAVWIDPVRDQLALGTAALRAAVDTNPDERPPQTRAQQQGFTAGKGQVPHASIPSTAPHRVPLRWHQGVPILQLRTPIGVVEALADTGAEGLFLSETLAARLPVLPGARSLRLVGFCGEQRVIQRPMAGMSLEWLPRSDSPAAPTGAMPDTEAIITSNPIFRVLGVEAIVGQELLRGRAQLWRLDQDPPSLELH